MAVDALWHALQCLSRDGGLEKLLQAFPADGSGDTDFNRAMVAFLPQKHLQQQGNVEYTGNRLLANAVPLRVEPSPWWRRPSRRPSGASCRGGPCHST